MCFGISFFVLNNNSVQTKLFLFYFYTFSPTSEAASLVLSFKLHEFMQETASD